jgi:hypothetical protein
MILVYIDRTCSTQFLVVADGSHYDRLTKVLTTIRFRNGIGLEVLVVKRDNVTHHIELQRNYEVKTW